MIATLDPTGRRYLEFACKCVRRSMEMGTNLDQIDDFLTNKVKLNEEAIIIVENRMNERIDYLEKDIVRSQRQRFNELEEKVKVLLEQKSIAGHQNSTMNTKKIKDLMGAQGDFEGVASEEPLEFDSEQ